MTILIVSRVPRSLRGRLSRWLIQIRPGVFIGTLSRRVREELWGRTCASMRSGWAVLIVPAQTEQGFDMLMHGSGPIEIEDFEGLWQVKRGIQR